MKLEARRSRVNAQLRQVLDEENLIGVKGDDERNN
jgi:hypothetical protein